MSADNPSHTSPLVSVICRTIGRPELQKAIQSVQAQTYPNIELLIVDAALQQVSTAGIECEPVQLRIVTPEEKLGRSQAANAGLEAAAGEYLLFLDDDDWIGNDHIQGLMDFLLPQSEVQAAYSSTQKTDQLENATGYVFSQDFDPLLLMRDNYIPIHSIIFQRSLLDHGCRFDERFDIYEDWDFWLQLSQHTDFQHIDAITAFYREGGDSETAVEDISIRYQSGSVLGKGRAAVFNKWLPKWTGEKFNALIGDLDQSALIVEQDCKIHEELSRNAELQHEVEKRDVKIDEQGHEMRHLESQHEAMQKHSEHLSQQIEQQSAHIEKQSQQAAELEDSLTTIYESISWKIMGPVRRAARFFRGNKNSSSK